MKGIVIEKNKRRSVIMDSRGMFVKTRTNKGWSEGDEVNFVSASAKAARAMSVAAVFVLVMALGLFAVYASNSYTVTMDVNPSIEIKVDAFNNVSEIKALNDDASEISVGLSPLVGMKFGPAVYVAVQLLLDEGYLTEDGTVVLSIEGKNGKLKTVEKLVSEALEGVEIETEDDEDIDDPEDPDADAEEDGEPQIKIYIGRITEEMAIAAEELEVPIGRMVLAAKAQEEGAEIDFEAASMLSVQELQRIRNLCKTINKTTDLIEGESESGNGNMKQIEAMTKKIFKEISRIEGNLAELQAVLDAGEGDDDTQMRFDVLTAQLNDLMARLETMGMAADTEFEEVLNGMSAYSSGTPEEKARIREEIKLAKEAENDAKKEENQSRIEEHLAEVKAKVDALKNAKKVTGEPLAPVDPGDVEGEGESDSDDSPGNSENSNAGGNGKSNGKGNGN